MPRVQVPRHVARLVTRLVVPLVVDYSSSTTLPRAGSSSTTPPHAGSSSTTSFSPHVRVPRHVAQLVTRLLTPLAVDYSASRRLVVEYFVFAARPGASARRAARHAARRAARR
jgi:hypothetical protein